MLQRFLPPTALFLLLAAAPQGVEAQTESGLRTQIIEELFVFGDCGTPLCLDLDNTHGDHYFLSAPRFRRVRRSESGRRPWGEGDSISGRVSPVSNSRHSTASLSMPSG